MADFRELLAPKEPQVLPYFGGTRVDSATRRLRVEGELAPGWWQFKIEGRRAVVVEAAAPVDLGALPRVRGHWVNGWVVLDGRKLVRVALPPDDEPAPLARVCARRWYSGDHVLDAVEFEDDAETLARSALEERRPLGEVRAVVPSLRVAFGLALGGVIARGLGFDVSVLELVPRAVAIADRGADVLREWIGQLAADRRRAEEEARRFAETIRLEAAAGTARPLGRADDSVQRADDALDAAGARMLGCRRIGGGQRLDVTYDVDGARIMSIVDAGTLQVLDPGICLSGAHRVLTLDAMPSVVREAIEENHLNILRQS